MQKTIFLYIIFVSSLCISCDNDKDCCLPVGDLENMLGTWRVYERGYSPGGWYIIEEVPGEPAQILNFESDNQFFSNYSGLQDFTYYSVLQDNSGTNILALYKSKKDMKNNQDPDSLEHSYIIEYDVEEGNLKLYFRFCIEGCHIGLKR